MNFARAAREIEQHAFSALLGVLLAVVLVRFLLLWVEIDTWGLILILLLGALSGGFFSYASQRSHDALFDSLQSRMPQVRAWCLKSMLWLLGTAAVIGVLTVLVSGNDTLARAAITVLVTAVVAGILWPLSLMVDHRTTLPAGLLGMISALVVYCLVIPLIWELDRIDDEMWMTSLAIGLTAPGGMVALLMLSMPQVRIAARAGTTLYGFLLAIFLIAAWHPGGWSVREEWAEFGWWVALYGGLSVACLTGWTPWKWRDWRWLGVAVSTMACGICISADVGRSPFAPFKIVILKIVILLTSVGLVVAHTSLTQLVRLPARQNWVRSGTCFAVILTAAFVNLELLFFSPKSGMSLLGRIAGAAAIVASCGSLALLLLARLNRDRHPDAVGRELTAIKLVCPQCGKKQKLALGGDECSKCGLRIDVHAKRQEGTQPASLNSSSTVQSEGSAT